MPHEPPSSFGQTHYHYDLVDGQGRTYRDLSKYQSFRNHYKDGVWHIIEARAVRGIDGGLVWFEHHLGRFPGNKITHKAVSSLAKYLNENDPLIDYLDKQGYLSGGIRLTHKRIVVSPDAAKWPGRGLPLVKEEVIGEMNSQQPLDAATLNKIYSDMKKTVDIYNKQRMDNCQVSYYKQMIKQRLDANDKKMIEEKLEKLLSADKPVTKRRVILIDKESRVSRSMRSIRGSQVS